MLMSGYQETFWTMVFSLLSAKKHFSDRWIGHSDLNRFGLHPMRMRLAQACAQARHRTALNSFVRSLPEQYREEFARNGFVMIENFLPVEEFERLGAEVQRVVTEVEAQTPLPEPVGRGFQRPVRHTWGFDRFDGGTLNRFIDIDAAGMPCSEAFANDARLRALSRLVVGAPVKRQSIRIYQTVHGDDEEFHDLQKDYHRDTFHSAMKFWFYVDPVRIDQGPFEVVPQSHRLTRERLQWEQGRALAAAERARDGSGRLSGAFRVEASELESMDLPQPMPLTVPGNTIIVADTLGFHRRRDANPGEKRLTIYGSCRPWPFLPVGI